MIFRESKLKGAFVIELERLEDPRGFFARAWCAEEFAAHGLTPVVQQSNLSFNFKKGTVRGMHFQIAPYNEAKTVRCTRGRIYDVIIDLRRDSATYKQWFGVELTADNYKMLYVPENFAHGYLTLEDDTEVAYQVSQFYTPGSERGIRWNDPAFNIEWPRTDDLIISEKDGSWPDYSL